MIDQCRAGVCRHRSLLLKRLAADAGLKAALVRGNYAAGRTPGAHAWNDLQLPDGRRYWVDSTAHPKDAFPEITSADVTPATTSSSTGRRTTTRAISRRSARRDSWGERAIGRRF